MSHHPRVAEWATTIQTHLPHRWEAGYQDPWLILTDLPPAVGDVGWYSLRACLPPPPRSHQAAHLRLVSVFRRGWNLIFAALLNQTPLPHGRLVPEPWPTRPPRHQQGTIPPLVELLQAA